MTERFLTVEQQARRRTGIMVAIYGFLLAVGFPLAAINAASVNVPAFAMIVLVGLAAAAWGIYRAFETASFIEIDTANRTCVISQKGVRGSNQPIDSLAPLMMGLENTTFPGRRPDSPAPPYGSITRSSRRRQPRWLVHPASRRDLALFECRTADDARRKTEMLAKAWGVSAQSSGGETRQAKEIDTPLFERLANERTLSHHIVLEPQWGIDLQPLSPGYLFSFTRPSGVRYLLPVINLAAALLIAAMVYSMGLVQEALSPAGDLPPRIIALVMIAMALVFIVRASVGFVRARPRSLRVTPDGVTLDGQRRLPLDHVEEVNWVLDVSIQGDGRALRIPAAWFPAEAGPILVREIKRAIVEAAPLRMDSR